MERSSFRARLFFIAGPAAAIVWSVYAAILTADARQRATESDQAYRQQARRVESAKRRFARARGEALLAMRRGGAEAAGAMPVPASAPVAGMAAVNGAAVVNGAGEGVGAVAPGAEATAIAAGNLMATEAQGAAAVPAEPGSQASQTSPASPASPTSPALPPAPFVVAQAAPVAPTSPAPRHGGDTPHPGRTAATPSDSIAVARAAAAERSLLILALREKLDGIKVNVDEIRLGSAHEEGTEWVRTVRIQLSGKKDSVKRAVASLKSAEAVREMTAGKLEPAKAAGGDMRTTVTGTLKASNPQALVRG